MSTCPFCASAPDDTWILTEDVLAVPHPSPISAFHAIIAPRRHVSTFYDLDVAEQRHIWEVLGVLRERIASTLPVQGFDVGFQDASESEPEGHAIVHLLPRVSGLVAKLPEGIEWVELDSDPSRP